MSSVLDRNLYLVFLQYSTVALREGVPPRNTSRPFYPIEYRVVISQPVDPTGRLFYSC